MKELSLRELQLACLDIAKEIDKVCRENGINYSLAYGSLIGAVRHGAFVPWDDDIDIVMPRPDYEKFKKVFKSDKYLFLDSSLSEDCYIAFGRVCDIISTEDKSLCPWHGKSIKTGVFVDVFPLDAAPEKEEDFTAQYEELNRMYNYMVRVRQSKADACDAFSLHSYLRILRHKLRDLKINADAPSLMRKFMQLMTTDDYGTDPYLAQKGCANDPRFRFRLSDLKDTMPMKFEDTELMVPVNYKRVLTRLFGDYMQLPPEKERKPAQHRSFRYYWK